MDYEEKYRKLIEAIKVMLEANPHDEGLQNWVHDNVPELTESEDEKVRKSLIVEENELRNREPDIYDIEDSYVEGYKEAVDKAYKWLKSNTYSVFIKSCSLFDAVEEFVGNFKQEMEGGEK